MTTILLLNLYICGISKQPAITKLTQPAKFLDWDEAPMTHRFAAECIDRSLRDLCSSYLPFGQEVIQVFRTTFLTLLP